MILHQKPRHGLDGSFRRLSFVWTLITHKVQAQHRNYVAPAQMDLCMEIADKKA
jgi:hypothetical protein